MAFAFLTTVLWALSAVVARRLIGVLGSTLANLARLTLAAAFLGAWAYVWGAGTGGRGFAWFLVSGAVGFGIGDVALYFALPRIGSRLTVLLTQCLAAPVAALAEWLWLGTTLRPAEIALGAGVIGGVALALAPKDNPHVAPGKLASGIAWGLLAAAGQGLGAVISRKAFAVSAAGGLAVDGGTSAFQRVLGGLLVVGGAWVVLGRRADERGATAPRVAIRNPATLGILVATALFGPVLGVASYQAALATTPSGVVLPIVALCPIVIVPVSLWAEGDRPTLRSLTGGAIAVGCAVALAFAAR